MKIGFIGLGKMGGGLARNLIRAGNDVTVYDINAQAVEELFQFGASKEESAVALARKIDILFTSLPLPKHLKSLLIEDEALLDVMKEGSVLIDVSTIDPQSARLIKNEALKKGIEFLACPLGKGPKQAADGTLPIFCGGDQESFEKMKTLFEQIGEPFYLGDVEQSTSFKLVSNMIGMTNLLAMSEGLQLGIKAGIDPEQLKLLLHDTGGDSAQLHLRGDLVLNNDYDPRFSVNLALKDVRLGVEMSEYYNQKAELCQIVVDYFAKAQKYGYGEEDCAAIYKAYAKNRIEAK